ncbi:hypothetical protein [Dyella humicola]|uniref:hypothetical protein n=1 Tax=Dyella humicola TaxID=2992126 RepID=UPI0022569F01|nr:hypothetical protein [Dyella humicola]
MQSRPLARTGSRIAALALALFMAGIGSAQADQPDLWDGNWHFSLTPYVWLPGIQASTRYQVPGTGTVQNNTNKDIFSYLSGAFMLEGVARKGHWGIYSDVDWVNFSNEEGRFRRIGGDRFAGNANLDTSWDLKGGVFNVAGLYSAAHGQNGFIDVLVGVRYLWLKGNVDWDFTLTGNAGRVNLADSGRLRGQTNLTDGIIGVRGIWTPFDNKRVFFPYYGDIGSGGSETTYQAKLGVGYAFDWGAIALVYRGIEYHKSGGDNFLRKVRLGGPSLSATFQF